MVVGVTLEPIVLLEVSTLQYAMQAFIVVSESCLLWRGHAWLAIIAHLAQLCPMPISVQLAAIAQHNQGHQLHAPLAHTILIWGQHHLLLAWIALRECIVQTQIFLHHQARAQQDTTVHYAKSPIRLPTTHALLAIIVLLHNLLRQCVHLGPTSLMLDNPAALRALLGIYATTESMQSQMPRNFHAMLDTTVRRAPNQAPSIRAPLAHLAMCLASPPLHSAPTALLGCIAASLGCLHPKDSALLDTTAHWARPVPHPPQAPRQMSVLWEATVLLAAQVLCSVVLAPWGPVLACRMSAGV